MNRDSRLNNFKTLLVLGMILAHSLQLLSAPAGGWSVFSNLINLITFSGFLFAFGYAYEISYSGRETPRAKKIRGASTILLGFYVSAFAWVALCARALVPGAGPSAGKGLADIAVDVLKVLLLLDVPPYSEFLVSFFLVSVLYWVLRPLLLRAKRSSLFPVIVFVPLALSLIPFARFWPRVFIDHRLTTFDFYIGLFFGSYAHAYFPVVQYLFFFLLGTLFADRKLKFSVPVLCVAAAGTAAYFVGQAMTGAPPWRFPPTLLWLTGSWLFLYAYWLPSAKIPANRFCSLIGENSLHCLVLSNILIFALRSGNPHPVEWAFVAGIAIVGVLVFFLSRVRGAAPSPRKA